MGQATISSAGVRSNESSWIVCDVVPLIVVRHGEDHDLVRHDVDVDHRVWLVVLSALIEASRRSASY